MTTPNTPAPGTPEWLRKLDADLHHILGHENEIDLSGLRAAAQRIEELEANDNASLDHGLDLIASIEENTRLRAENAALRKAMEHIVEYWNRDQNERAMADALWHIIETAQTAIDATRKEGA